MKRDDQRIQEVIVTTASTAGVGHIAPMGVRMAGDIVLLMPFRPSTTLANVLATQAAVVNFCSDARLFAGCVTGRRQWPLVAATRLASVRLADSHGHLELRLVRVDDDPQRPTLVMEGVHRESHQPFDGMNRARAAVLEGAVLVSRLDLLEADKIDREMAYLQIAIDKTAGPEEAEAWGWLRAKVAAHRRKLASIRE